ncbi:expressed unknown protein [Seminavis robusta]|uniref:Uncharacterized protein n=1 Tax=Seminavis robusta TaxID=568900 RepID=A0A9N8DH98_9STRA|nr:expressed unknown protein [Seminavis robusta]|eukprot:Sro90_g047330.1 n/a (299) ;mRNA; f:44363-45372
MPKNEKKTTTTTTSRVTSAAARVINDATAYTHSRFNAWVAVMVLSMVALISIVAATDNRNRDFQEKWSLAMAAISMCLGFLAALGHAIVPLREKFVSTTMELVMAFICVAVWSIGLPMITTPNDGLAVNHNYLVDDANLYFSSWGAFIFSLIVLAGVGNERGVSAGRDTYARRWFWLVVASFVVMAAASRMFDGSCAGNPYRNKEFCNELKMGVSLSVVSAVIAGIMTLLMWFTPVFVPIHVVGVFFCLCVMVIWCVLVAYLTFDGGPASTVGNLFFGVWFSAIISLDLGMCYAMSYL